MPAGVPYIKVAVAGGVIVLFAKNCREEPVDERLVNQTTQVLALVDERNDGGTLLIVVGLTVMAAAMVGPNALERVNDLVGLIGEGTSELDEAEGVEKSELLFSGCNGLLLCYTVEW